MDERGPANDWTPWIQSALMECNICSALVPGHKDAQANHLNWHRTKESK